MVARRFGFLLEAVLLCFAGAFTLLTLGTAQASAAGNVVLRHSCAAVPAGTLRCDAEMLAYKGSGKYVHTHPKGVWAAATGKGSGKVSNAVSVGRASASRTVAAPQPLTPAYLQAVYDFTALSATAGSGDTVAIIDVGNDPAAAADLATFRSTYGLPACTVANGCFRKVNETGQTKPLPAVDSGWIGETSLDIDAVSAICPNCRILLVEINAADTGDAEIGMQAAAALGADQISASFSVDDSEDPFSNLGSLGVSIVAASGDNGVNPVGEDSYPAADPAVVAAGGTTLVTSSGGTAGARGVSERAWSGSGGGCDTAVGQLSFQPASSCSGRLYADISADADPNTGLNIYDSIDGGWLQAGGTSLAAPIIAAGEALLSIQTESAAWVYSANALNPVAASSCSTLGQVLCASVAGFNGRTGMGSISGAAVAGAPVIALGGYRSSSSAVVNTTGNSVLLRGGIYPNGEQTTYYWQYGKTTAYGQQTAPGTLAASTSPQFAPTTLAGLSGQTTYHYRLVASNASGTSYGPDYTVTTRASRAQIRAAQRRARQARARAAARRRRLARARAAAKERAAAKARAAAAHR